MSIKPQPQRLASAWPSHLLLHLCKLLFRCCTEPKIGLSGFRLVNLLVLAAGVEQSREQGLKTSLYTVYAGRLMGELGIKPLSENIT